MKNVLLLLLALLPTFQLFADAAKIDSIRIKERKAFRDVHFFKLDKPTWKAFKKSPLNLLQIILNQRWTM